MLYLSGFNSSGVKIHKEKKRKKGEMSVVAHQLILKDLEQDPQLNTTEPHRNTLRCEDSYTICSPLIH